MSTFIVVYRNARAIRVSFRNVLIFIHIFRSTPFLWPVKREQNTRCLKLKNLATLPYVVFNKARIKFSLVKAGIVNRVSIYFCIEYSVIGLLFIVSSEFVIPRP